MGQRGRQRRDFKSLMGGGGWRGGENKGRGNGKGG